MYKNSFSLEKRKENAVLASLHFIRFENVIKNCTPIFGNQLCMDCRFKLKERKIHPKAAKIT